MIYCFICTQIDPHARFRRTTGDLFVNASAYDDPQLFAVVNVTRQIRQEFLTLLIFGDTEVTVEDLERFGPRSLNSPNYVSGGTFYIATNAKVARCDAIEKYASRPKKERARNCRNQGRIGLRLTATFDGDGRKKASFHIDLVNSCVMLVPGTRQTIIRTLARIFKSNDNIGIEGLFLAVHLLLSLRLEAVCVEGDEDLMSCCHEIVFEVSGAIEGSQPEIWMTPQRMSKLA